ncbi:MAG: putative cell survival pathways protein [Sclerophora amabilis]|nr:MAG: putative cell survival pathways protein [Sclerophora amabilis]
MMNWAKKQLADVAGTQEPIYGPTAIDSVANQAKTTPYTELKKEDLKWTAMESTCVETQTFYLVAESGHLGMAQVIYSNVAVLAYLWQSGIRTTCQFNTKIFYRDGKTPPLWSSDPLQNHGFDEEKVSFYADNVAVSLSEDANQYTIKSATNEKSIVNLTFTKQAPGFLVGKDGSTFFGTDLKEPWGIMRHSFWPRNKVEGVIITKDGEVDFKGSGFFVHALQGMKPHHAAAQWNFVTFQSPTYSAVMMEYTTPPSYGSTVVNIGGIAKDGEIVTAGASSSATHTETKDDNTNEWPEPSAAQFLWGGKTKDGQAVNASIEGSLGPRLDKVDIMAEVPGFVKAIVGGVAGTKPYIYQFSPSDPPLPFKIKIGDEEVEEQGSLFAEATFIS